MKFKRDYKIEVTADMNDRTFWKLIYKGEPANPSDHDKKIVSDMLQDVLDKIKNYRIMERISNNPKEKMRMNIELADNGIIIRNPDEEDEVTLAITSNDYINRDEHDLKNEYQAIGKKIYDWLLNAVIEDHTDFIITNFDIDVVATCKGREFK